MKLTRASGDAPAADTAAGRDLADARDLGHVTWDTVGTCTRFCGPETLVDNQVARRRFVATCGKTTHEARP